MTADQLIVELAHRFIRLKANEGQVHYYPQSDVPAPLAREIAHHAPAILRFLGEPTNVCPRCHASWIIGPITRKSFCPSCHRYQE